MSGTGDVGAGSDIPPGMAAWLEHLAAPTPAPGGGAAAAVTLAIGAAVVEMAAGYAPAGSDRAAAIMAAARVRAAALSAAERDAAASARLVAAHRLPAAGSAGERAEALAEAMEASLAVASLAAPLVPPLRWLAAHGDGRLSPDVVVAARTLAAAVRSAAATARANVSAFPSEDAGGDDGRRAERGAVALADELDDLARRVSDLL